MSDYYNLEKAAEVLGKTPGDLNKLRESGKIRAFRDGSTWKFLKKDIDGFLTEEIKARSSSMDLDDDLLNDSDDEDMPTMMAETNTFDLDSVEIKTNDTADVIVDDGGDDDEDDFVLSGGAGSSSISLADDDDDDDFASGISILDDGPSGSNVDLASDSGLSLDDSGLTLGDNPVVQSGSGSGISILQEDDSETVPQPPQEKDDFNLDELELEPLPGETSAQAAPAPALDPPASQEDESEVFELELSAEPESSGGDTYGVAGEEESDESTSVTKELDLEESGDFELEPFNVQGEAQGEGDTESSSQLLELDSLGLGDSGDPQPKPAIDLSKESDSKPDTGGIELGKSEGNSDPLAEMEGGEGSFGDGGFGSDGFGEAGFDNGGGEPIFTESSTGTDDGVFSDASDDSEVKPVAPIREENSGFTGLGVLLGLVPCILLLILIGAGVWELVRSMWSWEQPSAIVSPVLDTIGSLLKLTH